MSKKSLDKIIWGLNFRRKKSIDVSRNEFLRTVLFFESLTEKQLKTLASHLHERRYEENEYLFEVNHPGAALFIITYIGFYGLSIICLFCQQLKETQRRRHELPDNVLKTFWDVPNKIKLYRLYKINIFQIGNSCLFVFFL